MWELHRRAVSAGTDRASRVAMYGAVSASKTKTTLRSSWGHMHRCAASIIAPVAEEAPDPAAPNGAARECTAGGSFAPRAAAYGCPPKWQCACSVEHACLTQAPDQGPNAESRPASGASLERSGVRRGQERMGPLTDCCGLRCVESCRLCSGTGGQQ